MSLFGDRIKALRKERKTTLEVVAKACGTHKGYISGIESDSVNPPSVKLAVKLAKFFEQDAVEFVKLSYVDKAPDMIKKEVVAKLLGNGEAPK